MKLWTQFFNLKYTKYTIENGFLNTENIHSSSL